MTEIDLEKQKERLEEEKKQLEEDLSTVGQINPDNPEDWEAIADDLNILQSDHNEVADTIEEFEENTAIVKKLEIQLGDVRAALEEIEHGEYGICEIGGEKIDPERLKVYPSARTCIEHADEFEEQRF